MASSMSVADQLQDKNLRSKLKSLCKRGLDEASKVDPELVSATADIISNLCDGLPIASQIAKLASFLLQTASANFQNADQLNEVRMHADELEKNISQLKPDGGEWQNWIRKDILVKLYGEAYKLNTSSQCLPRFYRVVCAQHISNQLDSLATTLKDCNSAVQLRITKETAIEIKGNVTEIKENVALMEARGEKPSTTPHKLPAPEDEILAGKDEVLEFLNIGKPGIRVLCIVGIGGVGKTTLLDALKNRIAAFGNSATVKVHIGEKTTEEALKAIQENILFHLEKKQEKFQDIAQGQERLEKCFATLKTSKTDLCVCVDNVWRVPDLEKLFSDSMYGSLPHSTYLILTTRSTTVAEAFLSIFSRKEGERMIYKLQKMQKDKATELFRRIGEREGEPLDNELVQGIVKLCDGLPLALCVYATHFKRHPKRRENWKMVAKEIKDASDSLSNADADDNVFAILGASVEFQKPVVIDAFIDAVLFWRYMPYEEARYALCGELDCLQEEMIIEETKDGKVDCHDLFVQVARAKASDKGWIYLNAKEDCLFDSQGITRSINDIRKVRSISESMQSQTVCNELKSLLEHSDLSNLTFVSLSNSTLINFIITNNRVQNLKLLHTLDTESIILEFQSWQFHRTLRVLQLSNISCQYLSQSIGRLSSLQSLDLWGCVALAALPESIGRLSSLQSLDLLSCDALAALPESIGRLSSLHSLRLSSCDALAALPESIGRLSSLHSLRLSYCVSLAALPESIGRLSSLHSLHLSYCVSLAALPESIGGLSSLQSLCLERCVALAALPESIGGLPSLQSLRLWWCEALAALPESIGGLPSLQSLCLEGCVALAALPESIGRLPSLQSLCLEGCVALAALPESIGRLPSLQSLDLSGCVALAALPESIGRLPSLQSLDLEGCVALAALPESIGGLSSLQSLCLEGCVALAALPESIGGLPSLQSLRLSGCVALAALPESIGRLPSLQSLDLWGCVSLAALPESIGRLSSLQSLGLSRCVALAALPESIGRLPSLQSLDLWGCGALAALPESIGRLSFLRA